jgi:hypothetical protein
VQAEPPLESLRPEPPRPEPPRAEPPRPEPAARPERNDRSERGDRGPRRDPRRRDDDLGAAVVGFGDDTPAFMLVPARRRSASRPAEEAEIER